MDLETRVKNLEIALGWATICFCISIWCTNAAVLSLNKQMMKLRKRELTGRVKGTIGFSDENDDDFDSEKRVIGFLSKDIK